MPVKVVLVNECGSVLLGVHLLGDWEEAKPNRDLPTLLCWWERHTNEKWGSGERILPMYHLLHACHLVCVKLLRTVSAEWGRSSQGAPPAQDRGAVGDTEIMFSVSSASQ